MRFAIVTPVLNGEKFLNETILSVVTQAGPFVIRYHVQDGGSNDGTLDLLAAWRARLADGFPIGCQEIEFSFASAPDLGLYDAINRGFIACGNSDAMAWINADDRFEAGAFVTVQEIFEGHENIDWLIGRQRMINEAGAILYASPLIAFPQKAIAAGIFDGRFSPHFIQQEGTFWRPGLWKEVGGLNSDFKLAGDFDLWRRFARQTDLVIADGVLGSFRQRAGQLSADRARYYAEVDASLSPDEVKIRARAAKAYARAEFAYHVLYRDCNDRWQCEVWPMCIAPIFGTKAFGLERLRLSVVAWFSGKRGWRTASMAEGASAVRSKDASRTDR